MKVRVVIKNTNIIIISVVFVVDFENLIYKFFHFYLSLPALGLPVMPDYCKIQTITISTDPAWLLQILHLYERHLVVFQRHVSLSKSALFYYFFLT